VATWYGPSFPFYRGNTLLGATSQVLPRQEDSRLIRNDFIQGILTNKGERVFRPSFGGDVFNFLFEQNDAQSRTALESSIRQQTSTYHPRIIINNIDIDQPNDSPNAVVVKIFGRTSLDATNVDDLLVRFMVPISGSVGQNATNNPLGSNS